MLQVSGVDQVFRGGFWMQPRQVLFQVDLRVARGSVFGFLGENGAGKTTLIHLAVGLRKPARGTVLVGGHAAVSPEAKKKLGYLPERPYFYEHLTAEALLRYFGALSGLSWAQVQDRIPRVLDTVGLSDTRKLELRKFSKGMLQRIGIAQAILHDPELLVLDEPMSGLDPLGRKEIRELITRLASEGRTVFFSTHIIPDVEAICDQIAVIRKGRILGCGPIGQFLAQGPLQTEIAASDVGIDEMRALTGVETVRAIPDGVKAIVKGQEATQRVLWRLVQNGARVLWVMPIRPSLESLFGENHSIPANPAKEGS